MSRKNQNKDRRLTDLISREALDLLAANGLELVEKIGIDVVRGVVLDVLVGKNLRDSTEKMTRKRIASLNLAILEMFVKESSKDHNFINELPCYAAKRLSANRISKEERWLAQWMLGLTDKAYQNVLRDDRTSIEKYVEEYKRICGEVVRSFNERKGELRGSISIDAKTKAEIDWLFLTYLLNTAGSETLTIRGSEKSAYGKLFEKLILGALLSILDFKFVERGDVTKVKKVFWLSQAGERRESDATLLYELGKGIRFDIGFIGRGNPEISLDKVTRFEREIEMGKQKWYLGTIIIVDRIGEKSRIERLANRVGGKIIQMSMSYWPKQVAEELRSSLGYCHKLANMPDNQIEGYLQKKIKEVPLEQFLGLLKKDK